MVVAGVAKVADRSWPATARKFGTPAWVAPLVPWGEMGLGALMVVGLALPWTAAAAFVLLSGFTVVVAVHLARGDTVPCACFGFAGGNRPVSWRTLLRNGGLLVLTAVAVLGTR